jgi:drug/metabolite transporter (DMT)-like permease
MKLKSFLQLHLSVFLFGFTAILGDLIQLPTVSLVWWRVLLTAFFLLFLINPFKIYKTISRSLLIRHVLIGVLVAIHWIAFYGSIKVANASIVLIAVSTTSFITALVEPLMIKGKKWRAFDLVISILIIPAMLMIYYNASEVQQQGLWIGLIAAFVGAVFSVMNKMWLVDGKENEIVFIQQTTVWVILSLVLVAFIVAGSKGLEIPVGIDWFYLFVFAVGCTIIPYFLYLRSMKFLSAFDVSFAFNMEPVYGLIMAAWLLSDHQELSGKIYVGILFILIMVGMHTVLKSRKKIKARLKNMKSVI